MEKATSQNARSLSQKLSVFPGHNRKTACFAFVLESESCARPPRMPRLYGPEMTVSLQIPASTRSTQKASLHCQYNTLQLYLLEEMEDAIMETKNKSRGSFLRLQKYHSCEIPSSKSCDSLTGPKPAVTPGREDCVLPN